MNKNRNFKICQEDELLLLCARTEIDAEIKDKICFLAGKSLHWNYIREMSLKHGLAPLLYFNLNSACPERVPEDILEELKENFHTNLLNSLQLTGELIKILDKFNLEGINAIPFKGPSLAILAYNNLGLRHFIDIDIFVDKSDTKKANHVMNSIGYELETYPDNFDEDLYFQTQTEHKFVDKRNLIVEIHNRFQGHFFSFPVNPEFMFSNKSLQNVNINNYQVETLSNENLLIMLCIHCARHDWLRILWICDINELVGGYEINWLRIIQISQELSVLRILLINLALTRDLLGLELPDIVLQYINRDSHVEKFCREIKERIFSDKDTTLNILERTRFDLRKRERMLYGIKDFVAGLTRPTYIDFEEIPLPASLYPLYYLIRPFLLLRRYGRKPI